MRWLTLILCGLIGLAFLLFIVVALIGEGVTDLRRRRIPITFLFIPLAVVGVAGFFGAGVASAGGLDVLEPFEWPIGRTSKAVQTPSGIFVVPHEPSGRIQLYDGQRRFIRGWRIESGGGMFTLQAPTDDQIAVFTARGNRHFVYDLHGRLLTSTTYDADVKPSPLARTADHITLTIPTRWYLWPMTHPFGAWSCLFATIIILVWRDAQRRRQLRQRPRLRPLITR
jgi:hypothetical protein